MDKALFEDKVNNLVAKVKHYLITRWGMLVEEVSHETFYEAFSYVFREEIITNWTACFKTYEQENCRMLYYISMEYLPGKILNNLILSLKAEEIAREAAKRLHRDFDMIMHREREPGLGNGGLGRLASCFLDSLATLKIPAIGYGLRYQYGTFEQEICYGTQLERPDRWLIHPYPLDFRRDEKAANVKFFGKMVDVKNEKGETCYELNNFEEVRAIPFDIPIIGHSQEPDFSVVTLRLWSTKESPRNFRLQIFNAGKIDEAAENTLLTDVLYPNDNHEIGKRFRLKQEFLLVSASLQDIYQRHLIVNPDLKNLADKVRIQINDTHPALLIAEMMHSLIKEHQFSWQEAWETTQACTSFTNHTVMAEALEEWQRHRLQELLPRQYTMIERLNGQFKHSLALNLQNEDFFKNVSIIQYDQVKMAHLAIYGSHKINGVAKLHTDILKNQVFKSFYELYPNKFINITNGVTPRRWIYHSNPLLTKFISDKIGTEWLYDFSKISKLHDFANDTATQNEFLAVKKKNKQNCIEYITNYNQEFRSYDPYVNQMTPLDENSLFDMQIKRIHEYKRQLLQLIHAIILYQELLENPSSRLIKRTLFFGGKAAPGYQLARDLIYLIHIIAKKVNQDSRTNAHLKILFVENYNVTKAEILIPAADLSEQISLAGKEASGTGNMKLAMNGALTIGTEDGANIEMREAITDQWWPFRFGSTKEEIQKLLNTSYHPKTIYEQNSKIKKALDSLKDHYFAEGDLDKQVGYQFYHYLVEGFHPDPYFILQDLESYYQVQKKVEELYSKPNEWAKYTLHNIASMAPFSSDVAIKKYAEEVWDIKPQSLDPQILSRIKQDYDTHSSCTPNTKN